MGRRYGWLGGFASPERSKTRRAALVKNGEAQFVSPREYSEATGLHIATVYRRIYSGALRFKKDGSRTLIFADQLGGSAS
jgi:hypothetical protein